MRNVLFLDDNENRIETAKNEYGIVGTSHVVITRTAQQTIDYLNKASFDLVSLDHDLGGETYVDSGREDCGMEVVRWIVANRPKITRFIIHSYNAPAAQEMVLKLRDAGYLAQHIPFSVVQ